MNNAYESVTSLNLHRYEDERGCLQRVSDHSVPGKVEEVSVVKTHKAGTLRGFHFETSLEKEWKIMQIVSGATFLAYIDLRPRSPTFLKTGYIGHISFLSGPIFLPAGFANAIQSLSDDLIITYCMGSKYSDGNYGHINYRDQLVEGIPWPKTVKLISQIDSSPSSYIATKNH